MSESKLANRSTITCHENDKKEFCKYLADSNLNQANLFKEVWNSFKFFPHLTKEQEEEIKQAAEINHQSIKDFIKQSTLRIARRIIKAKDNPIQKIKEIDISSPTSKKAADMRVAEIVKEMIQINDNATNASERSFISQTAIEEYARIRKLKPTNNESFSMSLSKNVVKRYLNNIDNQAMLEEHHNKHGLTKNYNREKLRKPNNTNTNDRILN